MRGIHTLIECPRCGNSSFERVALVTAWAPVTFEIMSDGRQIQSIYPEKEYQETTGDTYYQCDKDGCHWNVPDSLIEQFEPDE